VNGVRSTRFLALFLAYFAIISWSRSGRAQSALNLEAVPVLGAGSPSVDGWGQLSVRLENTGPAQLSGMLELQTRPSMSTPPRTLSQAPFAVAGNSRVTLLLPSHSLVNRTSEARVRAVDAKGNELSSAALPLLRALDPLLFDLSVPSRSVAVLNTQPMPIRRHAFGYGYGGSLLSAATPQLNPTTGEPVLPDLAAGYASATLVLTPARTVSTLEPGALDALLCWVLSGGALAVVVERPEDLRAPWLEAVAGGHVVRSPAAHSLAQTSSFLVPVEGSSKRSPTGAPSLAVQQAAPTAELAALLFGLSGANLRPTPWGEAASYGLGEVHFLAFNPDSELAASDPWARLKMLDLVRHAWERAVVVALPHAQAALDDTRLSAIRRVLDPNESTRWTVVASAVLLLLYAALAGPLNFFLAQRKGHPLRSLLYLPIWSGLALLGIVVLGALGKGVTGRARHLSLIEAGAGLGRVAITRFRGLYGSSADDLVVRAARGSVLDVLGDPDEVRRELWVDRNGLRLEKMREKPWEVQVVREDGFLTWGGGVSLVRTPEGKLLVKNRCARDLLAVVLKAPGKDPVFFTKIADGQTVTESEGKKLGSLGSPSSAWGAHSLSTGTFKTQVEEQAKGAGSAWEALESATGSEVDWWPEDVPVLLAELEGGEGRLQDSGLRLDVDRVLVRVVGYGGVP